MTKAEVARRQLGAALQLFLSDACPVSVHSLACGGAELAASLALQAGKKPFYAIADQSIAQWRKAANEYWNALKHFSDRGGEARNDAALLARFSDEANDSALWAGWFDIGAAGLPRPVEAHVFELWFFCISLDVNVKERELPLRALEKIAPGISEALHLTVDHAARKRWLRKAVEGAKREAISNPFSGCDPNPLIMAFDVRYPPKTALPGVEIAHQ